jgi:DNA-directed RNA polymerase specialized sigma24 family protein
MAHRVDVPDPENLAADMVEECLRSMLAGRINAPTAKALRIARRYCLAYYAYAGRREVMAWEPRQHDRPSEVDVERQVDGRLTLARLQERWPDLSEKARDAMSRYLLGERYETHERKVGKNADNYRRALVRELAEAA